MRRPGPSNSRHATKRLTAKTTPRQPWQPTPGEVLLNHDQAIALALASLEKKAQDPVVLHVGPLVHYCGHFVIVNGGSGRQVRAITQHLKDTAKEMGITPLSTEGQNTAKWMILDLGDVVIHVFDAKSRGFYDLESLWADAEVVPVPGVERAPQFPQATA
ncbi:MAG: ribosome-associated protein [Cognaticolwellia sp.]